MVIKNTIKKRCSDSVFFSNSPLWIYFHFDIFHLQKFRLKILFLILKMEVEIFNLVNFNNHTYESKII